MQDAGTSNYLKSIALVFIGIVLAVGLYFGWFAIKHADNSSSVRTPSKIFINSKYGYEFDYPSLWQELKNKDNSLGQDFTGGIKREKPAIIAGVRVTNVKNETDFDTLPQTLDKLMVQSLNGFKKVNNEFLKVNGQKVLRYIYTFKSADNTEVKQMQQIATKNGKAYYFIFHGELNGYNSIESEINQIADSFSFQ